MTVRVKRAEYIGPCFTNNDAHVLGHDGAYSIPLDDNRVLWTFGDTLIGEERKYYDPEEILIDEWLGSDWAKDNIVMTANSVCIVNTRKAEELLNTKCFYVLDSNHRAKEIIPSALPANRAGRYRPIWPMDGICLDRKLYIFSIMVDCGPPNIEKSNIPDINVFGAGIVRSFYPYSEFEKLKPVVYPDLPKDPVNHAEYPYLWWNCDLDEKFNQVAAFGTAVLKEVVDGYVYIFGSKMQMKDKKIVHGVSLARVKAEKIEDITRYEYLKELKGSEPIWTKNPKEAMLLFDGNANELSVSYNEYLGKYLTFYSYIGDMHENRISRFLEEIHMRYADNIWGPWSNPIIVYKCHKSRPDDTCYAAKEHPEFSRENGKITYLTYVSHQRYWPELVKLEFE